MLPLALRIVSAITLAGCSEADTPLPLSIVDAGPVRELAACAALGGASPRDTSALVARINALPEPSLPCLLASLPRPLSLVATSNVFSAQPASGRDSPRIFVLYEGLTLSVVPRGEGSELLELGENVSSSRSLKGELAFPVARPLREDAPFHDLYDAELRVSRCGVCHANEEPHPSLPAAFVSDAYRGHPAYDVPIARLRETRAACAAPPNDAPQCAMLRALLDHGEVRQGAFPTSMKTGF